MRVLLIEPDLPLAKSYMVALSMQGHVVDHAVSAEDGVFLADDNTPDAVILEIQLAEHSGIEFLHEFRSYPEWQQVPVIVHTMIPKKSLESFGAALDSLKVDVCLYKPRTSLAKLIDSLNDVARAKNLVGG